MHELVQVLREFARPGPFPGFFDKPREQADGCFVEQGSQVRSFPFGKSGSEPDFVPTPWSESTGEAARALNPAGAILEETTFDTVLGIIHGA